jgi:hypothetical protein
MGVELSGDGGEKAAAWENTSFEVGQEAIWTIAAFSLGMSGIIARLSCANVYGVRHCFGAGSAAALDAGWSTR